MSDKMLNQLHAVQPIEQHAVQLRHIQQSGIPAKHAILLRQFAVLTCCRHLR